MQFTQVWQNCACMYSANWHKDTGLGVKTLKIFWGCTLWRRQMEHNNGGHFSGHGYNNEQERLPFGWGQGKHNACRPTRPSSKL